jgi:hypothetical protein
VTRGGGLDHEAGLDDRRQQGHVGAGAGDGDQGRTITLGMGEAPDEARRGVEAGHHRARSVTDLTTHGRQHARHRRVGRIEHGHAAALGGLTHAGDGRVVGPSGDEPAGARSREAVGEHVGDSGAGHDRQLCARGAQRAKASNTGRIRSSALRRLASELAYDRRR